MFDDKVGAMPAIGGTEFTFQERYCRHFNCEPECFANQVVQACLYAPWRWLTWTFPNVTWNTDRKIIGRFGKISSWRELVSEARQMRSDYQRSNDFGFFRRNLKRRLSSKRILALASLVWEKKS
jgi:hypothetical protein